MFIQWFCFINWEEYLHLKFQLNASKQVEGWSNSKKSALSNYDISNFFLFDSKLCFLIGAVTATLLALKVSFDIPAEWIQHYMQCDLEINEIKLMSSEMLLKRTQSIFWKT